MQTVNQIIKKASANDSRTRDNRQINEAEMAEIEYLFELLALEYPFFLPRNSDDLKRKKNMWASLLRPYNREQRMIALKKCFTAYTDRGGASVGEFMKLMRREAAHQTYKRLTPPPATPSVVEDELGKIKNLLGLM